MGIYSKNLILKSNNLIKTFSVKKKVSVLIAKPNFGCSTKKIYSEVKEFTKKSLHEWFENTKSYFDKDDFYKIYIDYPRVELIQRINKRIEQMIKIGVINEVKRFLKLKVKKDKSVNKAIGIHEIKDYLEKRNDMSDVIEKISIKTRQYAKRQSTWARGNMMSWLKLPPQDLKKFIKKIK